MERKTGSTGKKKSPLWRGEASASGRKENSVLAGHARGAAPSLSLLFSLLALFSLSGCVNLASTGPADIAPLFNSYWQPWSGAFFIPLMMGIAIITVGYMYSVSVRDDKLRGWCINELLQMGLSVLILIATLAVVYNLSHAVLVISSVSPAGGQQAAEWKAYVTIRCTPGADAAYDRPCHIRLSEDYLQILASAAEAQARTVLNYNSILAEASSIGLSFRGMPDPAGYLDISPLAGLSVPLETLGFVFDMANKNLMAIRFQQSLMEFMHLAFFPLFLSLGLFFRTMYFTRRLGGLLIAIALSAYVLLPLMYVFFHAMLYSFTGPWAAPSAGQMDGYAQKVGAALYPVQVDMGGTQETPRRAVKGSAHYDDPAPGMSGVKGAYSADGKIQPWEECNEWNDSVRTDTGAPNTQPFGCPPPGRPQDLYCRYADAKCTDDPTHGMGQDDAYRATFVESSPAGASSDPAFMERSARGAIVKDASRLGPLICPDPAIGADESKRLLLGAAKNEYERLKEGWGGALYVALAGNELLGFNGVIDNLAKIMIFSLVGPFIAIMAMLAGIKVLSPSLGGDVEIAGLTKLI